ncbi:MAG: accessory factor UbiK family protein [Robiginitomaculum sp.]
MQTKSKPFDDIANLLTNAMGAAKGVGDEVKAAARARADGVIADMDLVGREEFDVVKQMAAAALGETDALKVKIKKLEAEIRKLKK